MDEQEQPDEEVTVTEMIRYVHTYAIFALEDSLDGFKFDVVNNQGWTEEQAEQGYKALQKLIEALRAQADVVAPFASEEES